MDFTLIYIECFFVLFFTVLGSDAIFGVMDLLESEVLLDEQPIKTSDGNKILSNFFINHPIYRE